MAASRALDSSGCAESPARVVEETRRPAGEGPGPQRGKHGGLDVAGEGGGVRAQGDLQVDRHVPGRQDVALVAGQPPPVEQFGQRFSWAMVGCFGADGVGRW